MLALRRCSRHVVMADEQLDGTDMLGKLLGKRQRPHSIAFSGNPRSVSEESFAPETRLGTWPKPNT